jgi:Uncharacterized conserved protein
VALVKIAEGVSTIGFITSKEKILQEIEDEYWTVFVPTVPNPTSGLVLLIHKDRIKILPITVEAGMKILLSFGIYSLSNATDKNKSDNPKKN